MAGQGGVVSVPAGTRLGPYEIIAPIGAGGMGEVYRARDTRLGREVAIKTLLAGVAADSERLRRFEIEARAASQLSHPNILSIHDIGTADGQPYIVSELLEGENLREPLNRGPLLARKVIEIGVAVAGALAAAHTRGIVHRDLKPENVFLLRDGRPKVLDFGIAKLTSPPESGDGAAPTMTALTDVGVAVGTLGYMSPEQVRGERVDHRSDIFALGAILHEMLTGGPAFRRDSRIATVNAILESDPPELPDEIPHALRRIVLRCVEKNQDERFQSARDLAFALSALSGTMNTTAPATSRVRSGARGVDWRLAAGAALLLAALTGTAAWTLRAPPPGGPRTVRQFSFEPLTSPGGLALSPDGQRLVYQAGGTRGRLYLRNLEELDAKPIAGTEGSFGAFFSPDGQWVAFADNGRRLKKVSVNGGTAVTLADLQAPMLDGSWGADGTIVVGRRGYGLATVSAEGGTLQPITTPDTAAGEIDHQAPHALPGGGVLYTIHRGQELFRVAVRSASGEQRILIDDGFFARYAPTGHLVYGNAEGLFAAPFDLDRLRVTGPPVLLLENVLTFSFAADGTLAYIPSISRDGRTLVWVDRSGRTEALAAPPRGYAFPTLSPNGQRIAVEIAEGPRSSIWIYELGSGSLTRVSPGDADSIPVWSGDGTRLSYASRQKEERHIMWQPIDASAPPQSLVTTSRETNIWPSAWSPDSRRLIYVENPSTSVSQVKLLRLGEKTDAEDLLVGHADERQPQLSPDGMWLAYTVFDRLPPQVFVRPFAGGSPRQITPDGGGQPRWARNGREIYINRLGVMWRITIQTAHGLVVGKPEQVFTDAFVQGTGAAPNYDVTADGQRLLTVKLADSERAPLPIRFVVNWFDELSRRVPVQR